MYFVFFFFCCCLLVCKHPVVYFWYEFDSKITLSLINRFVLTWHDAVFIISVGSTEKRLNVRLIFFHRVFCCVVLTTLCVCVCVCVCVWERDESLLFCKGDNVSWSVTHVFVHCCNHRLPVCLYCTAVSKLNRRNCCWVVCHSHKYFCFNKFIHMLSIY